MYKIAEYQIGSHLYGTNTPDSDQDFSGIFIADIDHYFGLKKQDGVNKSIVDKDKNNKNTKNAIDKKFFEISKFIKLAIDNNPTIIEQLFIPEQFIIHRTTTYDDIVKHRSIFLHEGLYYRFLGYAHSQKKKMQVKLDRFSDYEYVRKVLQQIKPSKTLYVLEAELRKFIITTRNERLIAVGDIKIPMGVTCKRALNMLDKRFKSLSNRTQLIRQYGYDTKFASHLIRLTLEGIELLQTGNIQFPLSNAQLILDIKNGEYNLNQILTKFDELEKEMGEWKVKTKLPKYPDADKINNLLVDILVKHFYLQIKEGEICQNIL